MSVLDVPAYLLRSILLVALVGCIPGLLHADPFSLTANWNYAESGGDAVEDSWRFNQSYSLAVDKSLTAASDLTAAFRYTKTSSNDENDSEVMSPSAALMLRNDLFAMNFAATQSIRKTEGEAELTYRTWDATWFSQSRDLPLLRLNYGQSDTFDDQHPREQDTDLSYYSASIDYAWSAFEFYYDFRHDENNDNVITSTTDTDRHFAKVDYSESFFYGKVGVNFSQQYNESKSETKVKAVTGGQLFIPIILSQTLSAQDNTPLTGPLFPNGALNDGDKVTATSVEIAQVTVAQNLGMQTDFQSLNQLRVYLDREISLAIQGMLSWSLYTSVDNLNWDLISSIIPVSYELEDGIDVVVADVPGSPLLDRYVKLVVDSTGLSPEPVFVTELAAGNAVIATDDRVTTSSKFVSHQTRADLTYTPIRAWSFAYNLTRIKNEPDNGLENTQLNQGLSASYMPTPWFSASAAVNENRDKIESRDDSRNRTYSLSAQRQLWQTTNLSLAYTHSRSYEDSTLTSKVNTVSSFLNAQLFPDLSSSLTLAWSRSEDTESGSDYEVYGWRLNSTAQLTPRISANAYYDYSTSKVGADEADIDDFVSNRYGVNCNIRTSDILLFYLSLNRDQEEENTTFRGSVSWQVTPKIQTSFNTSQDLEAGELESYSTTMSWLISPHLSLRSSAGYRDAEGEDVWAWKLSMNATF